MLQFKIMFFTFNAYMLINFLSKPPNMSATLKTFK